MAAARQMKPEELVTAAAQAALSDCKGNVTEAARMMERAVRMDERLLRAVTDPLIAQACYDAVRRQSQEVRQTVWKGTRREARVVPQAPDQRSRVVTLATGTLAMFPLPGGKSLGDANRGEVSAAAEFYGRQSKDMGAKARWLQLVGQSLPEGKTVSEALTDERLRELQVEAQNARD